MQNQNSGGWRYGNGSNQFMYRNDAIDNDLLRRAAGATTAPAGLLDAKLAANPIDRYLQQSQDGGSQGNGDGQGDGPGKTSDPGHMSLGINGMGFGIDSSAAAKGAGKGAMAGPIGMAIGGLLGGVYSDPLGAFAQTAINAQEARDRALASTPAASSGVTAGGGWSSLGAETQAAVAQADDPIGAFADAIGMGADTGSYSGDLGYGGDSGNTNDGAGGYGGADNGYYMGGLVTKSRLSGPNPKGPDDGYAALKAGEVVIKESSVKKYGKGLLSEINAGTYKG